MDDPEDPEKQSQIKQQTLEEFICNSLYRCHDLCHISLHKSYHRIFTMLCFMFIETVAQNLLLA
jgi:hypothetical protein